MNKNLKSGVHTAELTAKNPIALASLPEEYRHALDPLGGNRYRLNIPRLPGMSEYNDVTSTQEAMNKALEACVDVGGNLPTVTRIDYRIDRYDAPYRQDLPLMRALVFLLAYRCGLSERLVTVYDAWTGEVSSVRAMPDEKDAGALAGVEYYDKAKQKKTSAYGQGRLELRRLNLHGETLSYVLDEWRQILSGITWNTYREAVREHARQLYELKEPEEKRGDFIRRNLHQFFVREEEHRIFELEGKTVKHAICKDLPGWRKIKPLCKDILSCLSF